MKAVCTGSFDPITLGHIDIFKRASKIVDELIICIFHNVRKKSFLSVEDRIKLIEESLKEFEIKNARVDSFDGLVTEYMKSQNIQLIIRGIRSPQELQYELNEADVIRKLDPNIETIFLPTDPQFSFVSSSMVRELHAFGASVKDFVPNCLEKFISNLSQK